MSNLTLSPEAQARVDKIDVELNQEDPRLVLARLEKIKAEMGISGDWNAEEYFRREQEQREARLMALRNEREQIVRAEASMKAKEMRASDYDPAEAEVAKYAAEVDAAILAMRPLFGRYLEAQLARDKQASRLNAFLGEHNLGSTVESPRSHDQAEFMLACLLETIHRLQDLHRMDAITAADEARLADAKKQRVLTAHSSEQHLVREYRTRGGKAVVFTSKPPYVVVDGTPEEFVARLPGAISAANFGDVVTDWLRRTVPRAFGGRVSISMPNLDSAKALVAALFSSDKK